MAPSSYFNSELKGFDTRIDYEVILKYYESSYEMGDRLTYKKYLIEAAIEKSTTGYQKIDDAAVSKFWKDYWILSLEIARELYMNEPGSKPSSSSFIYFRNINLPKGVELLLLTT